MSGPKLSQAELERRRREQLAGQRRSYVDAAARLRRKKEEISLWMNSEVFRKLSSDSAAEAQKLRAELESRMQRLEEIPVPDMTMLEHYTERLAQTEQRNREKFAQLELLMEQEEKRFFAAGQRQSQREGEKRLVQMLQLIRRETPTAAGVVDFQFDGEIQMLRAQLLMLAENMKKNTSARDKRLSELARKGSLELQSYARDPALEKKKDQVRLRAEELLNRWQETLRLLRRREERYSEYCVLASAVHTSPRPADAFADDNMLEEEIRRLGELYQKKDEMDFIATQINAVMIELGYQFVTSTALRRKNGSEYDYSLYQADEEAGISIYTDESGAVMMQMTMLGEGEVTGADEEISYQRQLDFCAAHPDILEALKKRGVLLKQVNYLPPSRKYASKRKVSQRSTARVVDRRRRRGKQKVRRMQ